MRGGKFNRREVLEISMEETNNVGSNEKVEHEMTAEAKGSTEKTAAPSTAKKPLDAADESGDIEESRALQGFVTEEISNKELEELYEESFHHFTEGELVKGRIMAVTESSVVVDIGYKSEGLIDVREFLDDHGNCTVKAGDKVEVLLEATENMEGHLVLSKDKAEKMKIWDDIDEAYKNDKVIEGRVIDRIKGGLAVDVGVRAFLPGSQVDVRPIRNLESLKGEKIRVKVIKLNKRRGNIVLSRREVIEAENQDRKKETLKRLKEGQSIKGIVKNITEYGAFIDLGGIDGLLHITDMSWGRISHPSELFSVGDEIEVVVLKYDPETDRVSLGFKQRWADPWEKADEKYPVNSRIRGKIVSITDYGAFIELEEGVEGLIHVSEMSWSKRVKHPSKLVNVGEMVEAVVLDIDNEARRISLGLKQVEPNPWVLVKERYREGDVIKGKVRNITDFGAFVEIEEGIDGLIHVSDMSWTKRIKHPSEVLKKGQDIEATVLNIDVENQRLSLGLKQLQPNAWDEYFEAHKVGDVVECKVVRITNFGVFVELEVEGVEGLIHASELDSGRVRDPEELFNVGDKLKAKIIKMDHAENKIGLSVRALKEAEEKEEREAFAGAKVSGKATLADLLGDKLGKLGATVEKSPEDEAESEEIVQEEKESKPKGATKRSRSRKKAAKADDVKAEDVDTEKGPEETASEPKGDEEGS
jgi:small subunit ribosomal protein S1